MTAEVVETPQVSKGLQGGLAGNSAICDIDGEVGRLDYRGYNPDAPAANTAFEDTAHLRSKGELPTRRQLDEFSKSLTAPRALPPQVLRFLRTQPTRIPPMTTLRSAVSVLGEYDPEADDESA